MEQNIKQLFDKYVAGTASTLETRQLYDYFETTGKSDELDGLIDNYLQSEQIRDAETAEEQVDGVTAEAWAHIKANLPGDPETKRKILPFKWIAAAAALLVIGMTITFMNMDNKPDVPQLTSIYGSDVLPGTNKATLTLSNGKRFELKDSKSGVSIEGSSIAYEDGETITATDEVLLATIEVPKGGIYSLKLADGTRVQLNSGSTFSYPTRFNGSERLVKLTGEGYFEVSHNPAKPFKVQSAGQVLTVLGTHFNVQAYENEPIETALLEGKVLVQATASKGSVILSPNQLAKFTNGKFNLKNINGQDYIGWTKNLFVFNDLTLGQIFKHLERWYDVDIDYPASISEELFMMEIPKNRKLSEILEPISDLAGLSFKIQGRRITVTKR
ncbi:FecR family protein [Edaphocola aurantiacus]|uniref:FecR family protein n=1 Tax=Edaphocola aurantiacus TaxID=2601682 RepID=UPI001C98342C|nr:FecR family protein [Edaphocola aurantiacus]